MKRRTLTILLLAACIIFTSGCLGGETKKEEIRIINGQRVYGDYTRDECFNKTFYPTLQFKNDCIFSKATKLKDTTYCRDLEGDVALQARCRTVINDYLRLKAQAKAEE